MASGRTRSLLWLAPPVLFLLLGAYDLRVPGPNYDEAVQAVQSVDFLEGEEIGPGLPGSKVVDLLGRPFPVRIQPYMGALKSHVLLPFFLVAGADLAVLRFASLAIAALGLLLATLWARRMLGEDVALVLAVLLLCDPAFVFISRHDWGSFPLGFLLRCASLTLVCSWWKGGRPVHAVLAGAAVGLGMYNKLEFAVFPVAALVAVAVVGRGELLRAVRSRAVHVGLAAAVAVLAALPVLTSLAAVGELAGHLAGASELGDKLAAHRAVLDGSYFLRLMEVGGRFDVMFDAGSSFGLLGVASVFSALGLAVALDRRRAPEGAGFVLVCGVAMFVLLLLVPGAVRAHHAMNLYPFPHLVVALGVVGLWRRETRRSAWRAVAVTALAAVLLSNLVVLARTYASVQATGGRGLWSDAIVTFAGQHEGTRVVCLDWGFHTQLAAFSRESNPEDAVWVVRQKSGRREPWIYVGDRRTTYLIHADAYEVVGFGPRFRAAVAKLPADRVEIRTYRDRENAAVFDAVRILTRHRVEFENGTFRFALQRP